MLHCCMWAHKSAATLLPGALHHMVPPVMVLKALWQPGDVYTNTACDPTKHQVRVYYCICHILQLEADHEGAPTRLVLCLLAVELVRIEIVKYMGATPELVVSMSIMPSLGIVGCSRLQLGHCEQLLHKCSVVQWS